jgi:hypothetical protein
MVGFSTAVLCAVGPPSHPEKKMVDVRTIASIVATSISDDTITGSRFIDDENLIDSSSKEIPAAFLGPGHFLGRFSHQNGSESGLYCQIPMQ